MKPVYFPFTYLSRSALDLIDQYLGPFVLYQPVAGNVPELLKPAEAEGQLEVRTPVQEGADQVLDAAKRSKDWGRLHQGNMDAFKTPAGEGFYNETFVAEIRSEIKGEKTRRAETDPLFTARLLLQLAQEFDRQQAELQTDLKASEISREKMFSELKGEGDPPGLNLEKEMPEDLGAYQTAGRILSWLRLQAMDSAAHPVWITTSRAVFDYILEHGPPTIAFHVLAPLPADASFRAQLQMYVAELAGHQDPAEVEAPAVGNFSAEGGMMRLTVAVLPVKTAEELLDYLIAESSDPPETTLGHGRIIVNLLEVKKI